MPFALESCNDDAKWDTFVRSSPQGSVFCESAFLQALDTPFARWWVLDKGRPCVAAVIPLEANGKPHNSPLAFTLYQGVLFAAEHARRPAHSRTKTGLDLVDFLLAELEQRYTRLAFCLHPELVDLRAFSWFHYHEPEHGQFRLSLQYTGLIHLHDYAGFEDYVSSTREVRRQEFRRGEKAGLKLEAIDDVNLFENLYRKTFERQGVGVDPALVDRMRRITEAALTSGFGELLGCRLPSGEPASITLFVYDDRCGYYLFAANDPAERHSGSGTYLMFENIRRCLARGVKWVDLCGINSPNRGDFKTSFNAIPVPYFEAAWKAPLATSQ